MKLKKKKKKHAERFEDISRDIHSNGNGHSHEPHHEAGVVGHPSGLKILAPIHHGDLRAAIHKIKSKQYERELARLLSELKPERVVVALPATLGATAAAQLLQALKPLGANALAVTHADETDQIGVAVEAACRFELAPEYMLEHARAGGWRLRQLAPSALAERLLP